MEHEEPIYRSNIFPADYDERNAQETALKAELERRRNTIFTALGLENDGPLATLAVEMLNCTDCPLLEGCPAKFGEDEPGQCRANILAYLRAEPIPFTRSRKREGTP